jgi:hypothetical protein
MAENLHLGVMKPEYLQRAQQLTQSMNEHTQAGNKAAAMSRHPSMPASRKKEFNQQAQQHLQTAKSNAQTLQSMTATPAETLSRRSNFDTQVPSMN